MMKTVCSYSTTVLECIESSNPKKVFVGKHVSENLEATDVLQWKHLTKNAVIIDKLKRSKSKKKKNLRQTTSNSDKKNSLLKR